MTNKADFLFELLTEELPPKALAKLEQSFKANVMAGLEQACLSYDSLNSYASPRRLAITIQALDTQQADKTVERRGPALNAACDADGNPTKAALGFAKSCGIELNQAETLTTNKGAWLFYHTIQPGQASTELLPSIFQQALNKLPIPKLMKWGTGHYSFIRPAHNVVMLFNNKVVACEFFGIKTTATTIGHRFHHPEAIIIDTNNYAEQLRQAHVIVDYSERKALIRQMITAEADKKNAVAIIPESLLEEVTSLVEWPVPLVGSFDKRFLQVPKEALILSMETHQKYFPLTDKAGNLLPHFVLLSNIDSKEAKKVIHGNEKVTRARLADAEFFYEVDKKITLEKRSEQLAHIVFQKQLGSLQDKTQRVMALAESIASMLNIDTSLCKRAASLCKADLVTEMVGEFPELQGTMGCYYAQHDGETDEVANALDEQYRPRFSGDELPVCKVGQVLAIADRLDTLVGIFGINKIPSGEKDPFGLRRASLGILRIIIEKELELDLRLLISLATSLYADKLTNPDTAEQTLTFCIERLKHWARKERIRADVFDAVAARQISKPLDFKKRLDAVNAFLSLPEAANLATANKRVSNILNKQQAEAMSLKLDANLLKDKAEVALAKGIEKKSHEINSLDYQQSLAQLAELNTPIDQFFTDVMVMVDNERLRTNRLALLSQLRQLFLKVADISLLQV